MCVRAYVHMCVCMCLCVRACVSASVHACVRACVRSHQAGGAEDVEVETVLSGGSRLLVPRLQTGGSGETPHLRETVQTTRRHQGLCSDH